MSQAFTVSNFASSSSAGTLKRGVWFKKGDVPAGSMPVLNGGTAQFYGLSRWSDGSLKTARLLLRDGAIAAGTSRSYTMTSASGTLSGATAVTGNAGLVAALSGRDFKVAFANLKDSSGAAYGGGSLTASLNTHAAVATRWTLLTTGSVADVWQGWGMAGSDAHLKVNWYLTRWKNADGSTAAWQIGAAPALDWWSVAGKSDLTYDATLSDGGTTILSFLGVQHYYHSQWLMCINDGSLNAGAAPWVGAARPTLHCTFDQDYAVAADVVPPLDTAKRPIPRPQLAYVPCNILADPQNTGAVHRTSLDAAGGYLGRGMLPMFDSDAFMTQTPQATAVARLNALTGLGVPYHYRSNRPRTRPGESADTANTNIVLLMAPKPASTSDFTTQGLPVAVDAYVGGATDGYVAPTRLSSNPWNTSLDASHAVNYCGYLALTSGEEWFTEATLDLAMNLAHQTIYTYHQQVQPFAITWNPSTPSARYTGLLGQWQDNNQRALGWSQLVQGYGFGLLPDDHPFKPAANALTGHNGDYIAANLDNLPADFAVAGHYFPENGSGLGEALFSPWMCGFQACGAYMHYLLNEDARWKRLGDHTANWALTHAEAGRWYAFDLYRTADRRVRGPWNASSNPILAPGQQFAIRSQVNVDASTGYLTVADETLWMENNGNPPPWANGDRMLFTSQTDGSGNGTVPQGVTDGQVVYAINMTNGSNITKLPPTSNPPRFQVSLTKGGSPITFSASVKANLGYWPQSIENGPTVVSFDPNNYAAYPYMPTWDNYVPVNVSVIMMARQAGNTRATKALRDGAIAFTAPMDTSPVEYYSAFDMTTAS